MKPFRNMWLIATLLATLFLATGCVIDMEPTANHSPSESSSESADVPAGLTVAQAQILAGLRDDGPAPELTNEAWLNSAPLRLADLRGNVVIIEFWTYG